MIIPIIYCRGGLGNQLFLFAFYIAFSKTSKYSFWDTSTLLKNDSYGRVYSLDRLFGENKINQSKYSSSIGFLLYIILRGVQKILKVELFRNSDAYKVITNQKKYERDLVYFGYAQDYRIPLSCEKELNGFYHNSPYYHMTKSIFPETFYSKSVALHIRHFSREYCPKLALYINKSLKKYNHNPSVDIIVFTDDKSLCNQYLNGIDNLIYYSDLVISDDYLYEFMVLSHFKNIIICNSTFSWWAAFLGNQSRSKSVVAPSHFVHNPEGYWNPSKLILPFWKPL